MGKHIICVKIEEWVDDFRGVNSPKIEICGGCKHKCELLEASSRICDVRLRFTETKIEHSNNPDLVKSHIKSVNSYGWYNRPTLILSYEEVGFVSDSKELKFWCQLDLSEYNAGAPKGFLGHCKWCQSHPYNTMWC